MSLKTRWKILLAISIYGVLVSLSILFHQQSDDLLVHDVSRLFPDHVNEIVEGNEIESFQNAIHDANENDLAVSIGGARHSQGGHSYYEDSVFLDMTSYNDIVSIEPDEKLITVESGATWADVQEAVNPYGLSVKVMQSSNVFTIGGSLSSNVHGRDPRYGSIIETVHSFRLLQFDGTIVDVTPEEHPSLFQSVIGGFGLFGVILDVTLELQDNEIYLATTESIDLDEYPEYIRKHVMDQGDVGLHFARLSASPDDLLEDMYFTTYHVVDESESDYPTKEELDDLTPLQEEEHVLRDKFAFGLSRKFDWAKTAVWDLQQKLYGENDEDEWITRNNAMRPPIEFLEYDSSRNTDILQEYFVPVDHFPTFVGDLREIVRKEDLNLLNATVRYMPKSTDATMSYAKEDMLAIVIYVNHSMSDKGIEHMEQATQQMVDAALDLGGTYYLTYQLYPTKEQLKEAYPNFDEFLRLKEQFDPNKRFMNNFYEEYES
ncbi:FAD/FMN-containing dehydrogenase [Oceanobacillus limi]|uniref:FAD/FMN-containing dehydrogenase n=1 Tax=Oceanobacillus limi TaxID=930131 RepID=A0A1H9Y432_9BACI|nr:FAD-binding oxidoreductase [Oceanobacillus limi]SES63617.1 FAD/FMN-containing dehydrogenase [Oceanobacillus limi]